jgi:hypothetical protein
VIGMGTENDRTPPIGSSWTRSQEEDEGDVRVYRPSASFSFPPTRAGRETVQFCAGGECILQSPGPDDKPLDSASHWAALGGGQLGLGGMPGSPEETFEVVEATPEVLKLRKL